MIRQEPCSQETQSLLWPTLQAVRSKRRSLLRRKPRRKLGFRRRPYPSDRTFIYPGCWERDLRMKSTDLQATMLPRCPTLAGWSMGERAATTRSRQQHAMPQQHALF